MNRELKFRAWDKKTLKMTDEFALFGEFTLLGAVHAWQSDEAINAGLKWDRTDQQDSLSRLNDLEVMQSTDVKDKNGTVVFEGDIIEYKSYDVFKRWWSDTKEIPIIEEECKAQREDFLTVRNTVDFVDGGFMLGYHLTLKDVSRGQKFKRGQSTHGDTESKQWDFEVIGNIYQNPELLSSNNT